MQKEQKMNLDTSVKMHRNYRDLPFESEKLKAIMMTAVTTLSTSNQLRVLAKAINSWASRPYNEPLTSEGANDLLAVKDALDALAEDLMVATSAVSAVEDELRSVEDESES